MTNTDIPEIAKPYLPEQLYTDAIRAELGEEGVRELVEKLTEDERWVTVVTLTKNDWTCEQVFEFAQLGKQWMKQGRDVRIHQREYHGLEIQRQKSYGEIVDTALENEKSRRSAENYKVTGSYR
jgi:hypothetical protein